MKNRNRLAGTLAAMAVAMFANDPLHRSSCNYERGTLSDKSISLFISPNRDLKEFSINGRRVMAYSRMDAIKRLKHMKKK